MGFNSHLFDAYEFELFTYGAYEDESILLMVRMW